MSTPRGLTALALVACAAMPATAQNAAAVDADPANAFYIYGGYIGGTLARFPFHEIDLDAFMNGIRDGFDRADPRFDGEVFTEAWNAELARQHPAGTLAFFERNAARDDVTVTESGLQYRVVASGEGASPTLDDRVTVHYTGQLLNGTVFESTYGLGDPSTFGVTEVIPGWSEALQLMKSGAEWEVWIPSELAYGPAGGGSKVPPDSALRFSIKLIDIAD